MSTSIDTDSWPHRWTCPECDCVIRGLVEYKLRSRVQQHRDKCSGGRD